MNRRESVFLAKKLFTELVFKKAIFVNSRLGTMRIVYKGNKIAAQIVYEVAEPEYSED